MTPWTVVYQTPLSIKFSRQEYCSRLPFPPPGGSSQPRDRTQVSCIAGRFFTSWASREVLLYELHLWSYLHPLWSKQTSLYPLTPRWQSAFCQWSLSTMAEIWYARRQQILKTIHSGVKDHFILKLSSSKSTLYFWKKKGVKGSYFHLLAKKDVYFCHYHRNRFSVYATQWRRTFFPRIVRHILLKMVHPLQLGKSKPFFMGQVY